MTSWTLHARELDHPVDTERAFANLFGASRWAFWLDSSLVAAPARYSLLGDTSGPYGEVLTARVREDHAETIFDQLERRLAERQVDLPPGLPPELACGYVGYLGYELKAYDGAATRHHADLPDAVWLAATRYVVVDHVGGRTWVLELTARGERPTWIEAATDRLRDLTHGPGLAAPPAPPTPPSDPPGDLDPERWLVRSRDRYLRDVESCLARLRAGESYEICLTNTVDLPYTGDPFPLYRRLRGINPAPYAAYLRLGDAHVLSASPERFLSVDAEGYAESRPIKGTAARDDDPGRDGVLRKELLTSTKAQAENLMIVDLLRNDLGRVCEPGTISVPAFLAVESYATVHTLVSTVRGRLRDGVSAVRAARACFPPGSMTGAPKLRTMEILDGLETRARGIYSGALGFFGLRGTADLSVVIRTAVLHRGRLTIGAGGAIVLDSDPVEEYDEMVLKAAVPLRAVAAERRGT
ncbi:anthranilate synthase component I family protein [Actinopolymorpha alba]|uniref:anthranilate synthase component I family protein n=1 Tax=Actinopolymorpha alba TaxID=533267 RepID=UPI000372E338|nr:anthranilate synthase component I family protein [Actinopolymorpha alba]